MNPRNVELGVLEATRELGTALVAFSPVARGFLAGSVQKVEDLVEGDIRRAMPRFQPDNVERNRALYDRFVALAAEAGCTPAQLSLSWVLSRGEHVLAIPGTTRLGHLEENLAARKLRMPAGILAEIDRLFEPTAVAGNRYAATTLAEIDTEEFNDLERSDA